LVLLKHFLKLEKPEFESSSKHGFEANQTSGSIFFPSFNFSITASKQARIAKPKHKSDYAIRCAHILEPIIEVHLKLVKYIIGQLMHIVDHGGIF
jgi:hypothetical protein